MKKAMNSFLALFLSAVILLGGSDVSTFADAKSAPATKKLEVSAQEMSDDVCKVLVKTVPSPAFGTFAGEWTVLALARSNYDVPKNYYTTYYNNVVNTVKEAQGKLSTNKYTEYSRAILGLTSIGRDPRNVGGYNLINPLADFDSVKKQGINGPIFALLALDSYEYEMPELTGKGTQNSRDSMIDYILSKEIQDGGWALTGKNPDPDITAMALQALAKYKNKSEVSGAIDRGIEVLSKLQKSDGGYSSWGSVNAESIAQVIVALAELGIDPKTDQRFIQPDGSWLLSALAKFYVPGKGFKHILSSSVDGMATDQCAYALAAYNRGGLYDMTDVSPAELEITDFAELTVKSRTVKYGTDQNSLNLPSSLSATVNRKKETISGITWQSEPDYDAQSPGVYAFTAVLPIGNYTIAGKAELPKIQVTVAAQNGSGGSSSGSGTSSVGKGTKTEVSLNPDEAPVVTGTTAAITTTVQDDITSVISGATAEKPEKITISPPTASILEQLKNTGVKTASLLIKAPKAVTGNTNPNVKIEISLDSSVLQAAKDSQKDISLSVVTSDTGKEVYAWSFTGAALKQSVTAVTKLNLALDIAQVKSDATANGVVSAAAASTSPSGVLLRFGGSGLLPGAAQLKIHVGGQEGCAPGSKLYLYRLNDAAKTLEKMPKCEYTVNTDGYLTLTLTQCSDYVLLPKPASNPYPVESDTVFPTGIKSGRTYTFAITVTGSAVPALTVGDQKAFSSTVKRVGNKYYFSVKAVGAPGAMTAVYSTFKGQKPVILSYVVIERT